jgi:hypothetical protein
MMQETRIHAPSRKQDAMLSDLRTHYEHCKLRRKRTWTDLQNLVAMLGDQIVEAEKTRALARKLHAEFIRLCNIEEQLGLLVAKANAPRKEAA